MAAVTPSKKRESRDSKWQPVKLSHNKTVVSGGYAAALRHSSGVVVGTEEYAFDGRTVSFAPVLLNTHWFLKIVGGESACKGHFRDINITDIFKCYIPDPDVQSTSEPSSAVADDAADDPMMKLKKTPEPKGKRRKIRNRNRILIVRMPLYYGAADDGVNYRDVTALWRRYNSWLIAVDDVPWLCEYVA